MRERRDFLKALVRIIVCRSRSSFVFFLVSELRIAVHLIMVYFFEVIMYMYTLFEEACSIHLKIPF